MDIANIAMLSVPATDSSRYTPQTAAQAVAIEFDSLLIQSLLQAGNADDMNTESSEMSTWHDMFVYSLAHELAGQGGFGFTQVLMNELDKSGGAKR